MGDKTSAVKLLARHACWQKLWRISHALDPGHDRDLIQDLVADMRSAGQSELAVRVLADLGETEVLS